MQPCFNSRKFRTYFLEGGGGGLLRPPGVFRLFAFLMPRNHFESGAHCESKPCSCSLFSAFVLLNVDHCIFFLPLSCEIYLGLSGHRPRSLRRHQLQPRVGQGSEVHHGISQSIFWTNFFGQPRKSQFTKVRTISKLWIHNIPPPLTVPQVRS